MAVIDKNMYKRLKTWWDWEESRPKNQFMIYVNSHNQVLTDSTIRKMMFDIYEEDDYGEEYVSFYSAESFYLNIREYFEHIANLYYVEIDKNGSIEDIIEQYPPTCGWITLIVKDIELVDSEKQEQIMKTLMAFASKAASIILIGNGTYQDVFSECEYGLNEMADGINAKEDENLVMIACYNQDEIPNKDAFVYRTKDKKVEALEFYWETLYEQLEKGDFDYENFKILIKETLGYLMPRVSKKKIYRRDLKLIENVSAMRREEDKKVIGCAPWKFDASRKFTIGLHNELVNISSESDDISENIKIMVCVEDPEEDLGAIHISGSMGAWIPVRIENVSQKIDELADAIKEHTYKGNGEVLLKYVNKWDAEISGKEVPTSRIEEAAGKVNMLMNNIKEDLDRIVNKEPGRKVCKAKGVEESDHVPTMRSLEDLDLKILKRIYHVTPDKLKGYEKLDAENLKDSCKCLQERHYVVLDKSKYTINEHGEPEITKAALDDYKTFIAGIIERTRSFKLNILDEGYDETDGLDWHITLYKNNAEIGKVATLLEFDVCVRTEEELS